MFVSVDHCQRDRHGVADKRYGHCVSGNVRKSAQSRQPRLGESGDVGGKSQVKHECVWTVFSILFSSLRSEKLPGWDVANYLNVVNSVQREGKGHACRDDHLQIKT